MAISIEDIERKVKAIVSEVEFDRLMPSSNVCNMMNMARIAPCDLFVREIFDIVNAMKIRASEPLQEIKQKALLKCMVMISKVVDQCNLTDTVVLKVVMDELVGAVLCNTSFALPQRHKVVTEVLLRCRYSMSERLLLHAANSEKVRRALPSSPSVLLFATHVQNIPIFRYALHKLGALQWDMSLFMYYLGKDSVLERVHIKKFNSKIDNSFRFSKDSYLVWPMSLLRANLNKRDFLLACFAISEEVYVSTCLNLTSQKNINVTSDLIVHVKTISEERPKWHHSQSKWESQCRMKCLLYTNCLQMHCERVMGLDHFKAHQELRIRRAMMILKLCPLGGEYLNLWVRFWMDTIYNLFTDEWSSQEIELLQICEQKFQKTFPNISHWIFFYPI